MDWKNQLWRIICNYWIAQDISELLHLFKSKYQILRFFNNLGFAKTEPKIRIIEWSVLLLLCSSTMSKLRKTFLFFKHKCAYFIFPFSGGVQLSQSYRITSRRQFTFYHSVPGDPSTYLINLKRMKGHCALTTRPLYPLIHWSLTTGPLGPNIFSKGPNLRYITWILT